MLTKKLQHRIVDYLNRNENTNYNNKVEIIHYLKHNFNEYKRIKNSILISNINKVLSEMKINSNKGELKTIDLTKDQNNLNNNKANYSLNNIGGNEKILAKLKELITYPIKHSEIFQKLGIETIKGILFYGPSGCGKTLTACTLAHELKLNLIKISAAELIAGISGESSLNIRELFKKAKSNAPCIILIDEIDIICSKNENNQKSVERRMVAQLASCFDDIASFDKIIVVIGTTSKPEILDSKLRCSGRIDHEIEFKIPTREDRNNILKILSKKRKLSDDVNLEIIADKTVGYVGGDLSLLTKEASKIAVKRIINTIENISNVDSEIINVGLRMDDYMEALKIVKPSMRRKGFAETPNITWKSEIGGLDDLHKELKMLIVYPILFPKLFEKQGLDYSYGVLLYGPPGCGKTLVAKAIAAECNTSFISIKGPELLNQFVGESERAIRELFNRATSCSPCIIFFDEIDALVSKRTVSRISNDTSSRIITQLLTELDGMGDRKQVFVIAATNRPDMLDPAMLRPGRLDSLIYVPLPSEEERIKIIETHLKKVKCNISDILEILNGKKTEGYSGADCASLVKTASYIALEEYISIKIKDKKDDLNNFKMEENIVEINKSHIERALLKVYPSVSGERVKFYNGIEKSLKYN